MIEQPATIAAALQKGRDWLARSATDTPRLDAEVLLRSLLGLDRTALFTRLRDPIDPTALQAFLDLIDQRARGVPVAYLTGEREFMGMRFTVGPGVLIPRPETEILVEWALDWLRERPGATVADVGTGSGAIAFKSGRTPWTRLARARHWRRHLAGGDRNCSYQSTSTGFGATGGPHARVPRRVARRTG